MVWDAAEPAAVVSGAAAAVVVCALIHRLAISGAGADADPCAARGQTRDARERVHTRHLLQPLKLRGLTIRNRAIRAAAYAGSSLEEMKRCHKEVAEGGIGMTTVAYCAVHRDGRYKQHYHCRHPSPEHAQRPMQSANDRTDMCLSPSPSALDP